MDKYQISAGYEDPEAYRRNTISGYNNSIRLKEQEIAKAIDNELECIGTPIMLPYDNVRYLKLQLKSLIELRQSAYNW